MATRKKLNKKVLFVNDNETYKDCSEVYLYIEIFEFNGKKFQYTVDFHNGSACGFDHNKCIAVMKPDGTWANIADSKMVGASYGNPYYCSLAERVKTKDKYIAAFDDFVSKVYS